MMSEQKNAPGAAVTAAEGEIPSVPSEGEPIMNTVPEPIRPIYGPNDHRWDELAGWFERNASELVNADGCRTATLEELQPIERAEWHSRHVLGVQVSMFEANVELPDFPGVPWPIWATSSDFRGIDIETEHPMQAFIRELGSSTEIPASIEQEATFNPDTGAVRWSEPFFSVYTDGNTEIRITEAAEARRIALVLREGAAALEGALRERDGGV